MQYILTENEYQYLLVMKNKPAPVKGFVVETPVTMADVKIRYAKWVLDQCGGDEIKAAKILGIRRKGSRKSVC